MTGILSSKNGTDKVSIKFRKATGNSLKDVFSRATELGENIFPTQTGGVGIIDRSVSRIETLMPFLGCAQKYNAIY